MKTYDYLCRTPRNVVRAIEEFKFSDNKKYLLRIHSSNISGVEMGEILRKLKLDYSKVSTIGCSCGGVIYKGKGRSENTLVSITELEGAEVKIASVELFNASEMSSAKEVTEELAKKLDGISNSTLLIFFSSQWYYASSLPKELLNLGEGFTTIGGGTFSATGEETEDPNYTICNGELAGNVLVCAKISGDKFYSNTRMANGVEALGKTYTVTRTDGHVLKEIDEIPAKQWYKKLIGEKFINENENIIHAFPLVRNSRKDTCTDIFYEVNPFTGNWLEDDLFVFDNINEGEMIRVGCINPELSVQESRKVCKAMKEAPLESMFVYSCMTRRLILKNCSAWEMSPYMDCQFSGAFLAGELGFDGITNKYSNCAFVTVALSENENARGGIKAERLYDAGSVQFDNQYLLTYFLSTANSELKSEMLDSLERLEKNIAFDAMSGLPSLSRFIYDSENGNVTAAMLISLRNEETIKAVTYGRDENILNSAISLCRRFFERSATIYAHSDLSLIVASSALTAEKLQEKAERLYYELNTIAYKDYVPVWQFSIGMNFGENLLKILNLMRTSQRRSGEGFLIYDENGAERSLAIRELKVLEVINDALAHDRVVPYYQGIRDNATGEISIYESLMRVFDKDGNIYTPLEAIAVANQYGLYSRLSKRMINRVFRETEKAKASVTINLNYQDVIDKDVTELLFEHLSATEHPERYIIEFLEAEAVTDYDVLMNFAERVRELGGRLALDDYGMGQSNFFHFNKLDTDFVKIAGEIICEAEENEDAVDFISYICKWAKKKGKKIVCERVENETVQKIVTELGGDYTQGFLFSQPKPINECGMLEGV